MSGKAIVSRWLSQLVEFYAGRDDVANHCRLYAVALVLVRYANADGGCANVSQRTIAREVHQHLGRVNESLRRLVADGWVRIDGHAAHRSHRRRLTIPSVLSDGGTLDSASVPLSVPASVPLSVPLSVPRSDNEPSDLPTFRPSDPLATSHPRDEFTTRLREPTAIGELIRRTTRRAAPEAQP